ncbi:hypothetical protein [Atopomonas sediminilitoris]|uniref:hypothetical protein n=1 Tax=Atopomonas sediminilitoris TaxID=2919919 RepID=UPI001F4E08E5|nr:hypothetical protein [Atopomonas sediminilitoris]MCJ8170756.1 hypothetical protein [Atopomonas sediminilitoris]
MTTYYSAFLALTLALTSGCGLIPRTGEPSLALQVADAMAIPAEDVSQAEFASQQGNVSGQANHDNLIDGALSLAPGMLLLGAFARPTASQRVQMVAWVPHDQAVSGEAAIERAIAAAKQAMQRMSTTAEPQAEVSDNWRPYYLGMPFGDVGFKSAKQLYQQLGGYTPSLESAPSFMASQQPHWAPIYLDISVVGEGAQAFTAKAPAWFYVYDPGQYKVRPKAIYNRGKAHYFVAPSH